MDGSKGFVGLASVCVAGLAASASAQSIQLTHSLEPNLVVGGSVACQTTGDPPGSEPQRTTQNSYYRSFDLAAMGVTTGIDVTSVDFGIENATHPNMEQNITVNLWHDTAGTNPPVLANLVLVGTVTYSQPDTQLEIVNVPVTGTVPAGGTLVVEIDTEDHIQLMANAVLFIGSNPFGQTGPSYIRAPQCALNAIDDLANIGFPNMHLIMTVNGEPDDGCYPDCDGSGTLDFFDFLCFQNAFLAGDPYADCDGSGTLDFFDFLCFQNEFLAGCP
jgi:hypothetical protein